MSTTTTLAADPKRRSDDVAATPDEGDKPKKSKKKLLIVVAVLLVLLGVGGFVGKGMLGKKAAPEPDPKKLPGVVVTLAPMTMNLADGRYLKLTLALQLSEAASPVAGSAEAAAATAPAVDGAKALDAAIGVLGQRSYAQLIAPGGRAGAQKALSAQVKKRYDGDVLGVYFTEFLMQ